MMIAQADGRNEIIGPMLPPASLDDLKLTANFMWTIGTQIGIPAHEMVAFFEQMLTFLTSCQERRIGQWERMSWLDFIDAKHKSPAFKKFIATGMTRTLVAARAEEMSARTGASILWQLMFCTSIPGRHADGVLTGPTSEVWIDPWVNYLRSRDVELHECCTVEEIHCDGRGITGVTVRRGAHRETNQSQLLRFGDAPRAAAVAADRRAARGRTPAAAREGQEAADPLDERHDVLPSRGRAAGQRPHPLHRLRVGSHRNFAKAVLARRRFQPSRKRTGRRNPVGRHLGLVHTGLA